MGRLTKDPEVRYTQNNMTVANFSIAVSRRFAKENDEVKADFFNVIAWNKTVDRPTRGKALCYRCNC